MSMVLLGHNRQFGLGIGWAKRYFFTVFTHVLGISEVKGLCNLSVCDPGIFSSIGWRVCG